MIIYDCFYTASPLSRVEVCQRSTKIPHGLSSYEKPDGMYHQRSPTIRLFNNVFAQITTMNHINIG